ncbi:MAG: hypothetical protein JWR29_564 [Tardiphaga sp.]|nr:hypothetical protein [Tardiphaga sp.]
MSEEAKPEWKVPRHLRVNARVLLKNSTDAERLLWAALRNHRLNGFAFRRQVPIKTFIADFACNEAKLVIEIDGGQHYSDEQERNDGARSAMIEAAGFRVLRFNNRDVMTNRAGVLQNIVAALEASAPSPTLPRKRERERAAADETLQIETGKPQP